MESVSWSGKVFTCRISVFEGVHASQSRSGNIMYTITHPSIMPMRYLHRRCKKFIRRR
jgi:hypothetical protein